MSLSEDEVSDLKSFIDRKCECEKQMQIAKFDADAANAQLANFLHYQQFPPREKK